MTETVFRPGHFHHKAGIKKTLPASRPAPVYAFVG
jgi:hypothetical protein